MFNTVHFAEPFLMPDIEGKALPRTVHYSSSEAYRVHFSSAIMATFNDDCSGGAKGLIHPWK